MFQQKKKACGPGPHRATRDACVPPCRGLGPPFADAIDLMVTRRFPVTSIQTAILHATLTENLKLPTKKAKGGTAE